jgi:hypothetical protein
MDAQIPVTGGMSGELADLGGCLGDEAELRGRVRAVRSPVGDTALASSVKTWLIISLLGGSTSGGSLDVI